MAKTMGSSFDILIFVLQRSALVNTGSVIKGATEILVAGCVKSFIFFSGCVGSCGRPWFTIQFLSNRIISHNLVIALFAQPCNVTKLPSVTKPHMI